MKKRNKKIMKKTTLEEELKADFRYYSFRLQPLVYEADSIKDTVDSLENAVDSLDYIERAFITLRYLEGWTWKSTVERIRNAKRSIAYIKDI